MELLEQKAPLNSASHYVIWRGKYFAVRSTWSWWSARYNGPSLKNKAWNLDINEKKQKYYASIHQAAYDYYNRGLFNLKKPTSSYSVWSWLNLRISARLSQGSSSHVKGRRLYGGSDIFIKEYESRTDRIYATTIHELAHAAHRNNFTYTYNKLFHDANVVPAASFKWKNPKGKYAEARRITETWATTVEHTLTSERYRRLDPSNHDYVYESNLQDQTSTAQNFYSSLGLDLIDTFDQRAEINSMLLLPRDSVSGYTIKQIENSLQGSEDWDGWKANLIKQNPNNPTNPNMDELFNNW